jgi:hypothetical protein
MFGRFRSIGIIFPRRCTIRGLEAEVIRLGKKRLWVLLKPEDPASDAGLDGIVDPDAT